MPTRFIEGTSLQKQALYHTTAFFLNSTEIGVWGAAAISMSTATNFDTIGVVKQGAIAAAAYLVPGAPAYTFVKNVDKAVATGKEVAVYGKFAYKAANLWTAPIVYINSLGARACTRYGVTEALKKYCGVVESDAFYWERPEHMMSSND